MHTKVHQVFAKSTQSEAAKAIIAKCVHCGYCTAASPTYQELKDDRDGPRGRIYLIKQFLETGALTEKSRLHLDRCLTCRSCETACPSGVEYGRLIDVARGLSEQFLPRSNWQKIQRWSLARILPNSRLFAQLLYVGRTLKPLLPEKIQQKIPPLRSASPWPKTSHQRVMILLAGCAQSATAPNTNAAAARVLDKLSISVVESPLAGCCGAVNYHLAEERQALAKIKVNIDAWWPAIEAGAEAVLMTASGCGAMVQDYGYLMAEDPKYAAKAKRISELCKDLSQVLNEADLSALTADQSNLEKGQKIAYHCPCTLKNALRQGGAVEQVLKKFDIDLAEVKESSGCCGSAGTYSILQPVLSQKLLAKKLQTLTKHHPTRIVTANIGCQLHLQSAAKIPVDHWIELIDELIR